LRLAGGVRGDLSFTTSIWWISIPTSAILTCPSPAADIAVAHQAPLQRQTVKLTIAGDKLRYETGLASKSMRIIQLPKVQDVRVIQSFWQRMFGVGDVSIETAGENSRLVVENLDRPRQLAEQITDASGASASTGCIKSL
jgi:membrane protein YdbS with pleckstrin-like domain